MKQRPFLTLWTLAVAASSTAFIVHLALRGRIVDIGYELGRARNEQARLREVRRVLSLEAASYENPARVDAVARSVLQMAPPTSDRVVAMRALRMTEPLEPQGATEEAAMESPARGLPEVPDAQR